MRALGWILAFVTLSLTAQTFKRLPEWAVRTILTTTEPEPTDADAWVLLDRTEMAYVGDGEIRTHRMRLVRVLTEKGLKESTYALHGLGGRASKVIRLKGWNLRPDDDLVKLDTESVVALDSDPDGQISTSVLTAGVLPRVVKGSLIAFESMESIRHPMGPAAVAYIMEENPIRRWELEAVTSGGWFTNLPYVVVNIDALHLDPWLNTTELKPGTSIKISGIPAIPRNEDAIPRPHNALPSVLVRFQDPAYLVAPSSQNWDSLAQWIDGQYQQRFQPSNVLELAGKGNKERLQAIHGWLVKEFIYKQVYLTPERGWIPAPGPDIVRHRYGDCKDLTCCLLSEAKGAGFGVHPVMALIGHGFIEDAEIPSPTCFDHVLGAIQLSGSLGFPAEFETPAGRFLLVDPTSRFTPLGFLPAYHRGRRVMICTPKGAQWVRVPVEAVQIPSSEITIDGDVDSSRAMTAKLKIKESANHFGLRQTAVSSGQKGVSDLLATILDLSPSASMQILAMGDPMDSLHAFEVTVGLQQPDGLHRERKDEILLNWGMPFIPNPIQRPGEIRRFPVESVRQGKMELSATYRLPASVLPRLPKFEAQSAFRTIQWSAQTRVDGGKVILNIVCKQELNPAYFDFDQREKGVTEWKKDRSQVLQLRSSGLAFAPSE